MRMASKLRRRKRKSRRRRRDWISAATSTRMANRRFRRPIDLRDSSAAARGGGAFSFIKGPKLSSFIFLAEPRRAV